MRAYISHRSKVTLIVISSSSMDITLKCPFTMLVCGSSGSGKTVFTQRLLENHDLLRDAPKRIVWCYGVWQEEFSRSQYELHQGQPTDELSVEGI